MRLCINEQRNQLPIAVFIFRFRMINSTQYRKHAIKRNVPYRQAIRWYWKPMLGSCLSALRPSQSVHQLIIPP